MRGALPGVRQRSLRPGGPRIAAEMVRPSEFEEADCGAESAATELALLTVTVCVRVCVRTCVCVCGYMCVCAYM